MSEDRATLLTAIGDRLATVAIDLAKLKSEVGAAASEGELRSLIDRIEAAHGEATGALRVCAHLRNEAIRP
jgi:hypothetical protein